MQSNRARQGTVGGEKKSDPHDARTIAEQVRTRSDLRPTEPATELDLEIRLLVGRRSDIVQAQTQRLSRMRDLLVPDHEPHEWTPLASELLAKAPDIRAVLEEIVRRLHPTGWSGSLATKLESRLKLLEQLTLADKPGLADAFNAAKALLEQRIAAEGERASNEDRSRSGRFK